jgi:small-conductance mechanosensitive channel
MINKEKEKWPLKSVAILGIKITLFLILSYIQHDKQEWLRDLPLIRNAIRAIIFFLGVNVIISLASNTLILWYKHKHEPTRGFHNNFILGIHQIASVLNVVAVIIALLLFFNFNPISLFTSISIAAAAFALLTKDYITQMINGLIIMFSNKLSLGDHIIIGEHRGKIVDITLINIIIKNDDNDMVLIPNNSVFNTAVINQSKQNVRLISMEFELSLTLHIDPDDLENYILDIVRNYPAAIPENSFLLKVNSIHKDYVKYKLQFQMNLPDRKLEKKIKRRINKAILAFSMNLQKNPTLDNE